MAVAVGDVWTFALEQRLFEQQVINTFALKITQTAGGVSENQFVDNWFLDATGWFNTHDGLRSYIIAMQSSEIAHKQWIVQRVTPNPTQTFIRPIVTETIGAEASTCETANLAMAITRKGLAAGRRNKGRFAIAGIPVEKISEGAFTNAWVTLGNAAGVAATDVKTRVAGDQVTLGFWSPAHDGMVKSILTHYPAQFVECVSARAQRTVRVQRSRTLGVGS